MLDVNDPQLQSLAVLLVVITFLIVGIHMANYWMSRYWAFRRPRK